LTEKLPTVIRLLNFNVSEAEIKELTLIMNKKTNKNYFLFEDLLELLHEFNFIEDTEQELLSALYELD
jgi:Ca2+-binding EF-hand superfamily protein